VATESFETIAGNFGRMVVAGDDRHARLIRQLVAACQRSARPWQFSRTGKPSILAERFELDGLKIEHHPTERRFRLTVPLPEGTLALEETGYPTDSTLVNPGRSESSHGQVRRSSRSGTSRMKAGCLSSLKTISWLSSSGTGLSAMKQSPLSEKSSTSFLAVPKPGTGDDFSKRLVLQLPAEVKTSIS